jgi:hypothetical protein
MNQNDSLSSFQVKPGDPLSAERENRLLNRIANMALETAPGRRSAPSASLDTTFPFEVTAGVSLAVAVEGGTVVFHDQLLTYAGVTNFAVAGSLTAAKLWAYLDDEFAPTSVAITIASGGWTDYPAQPIPPSRKHFLLAEVTSDSSNVTAINVVWKGNIVWPAVYGFYS